MPLTAQTGPQEGFPSQSKATNAMISVRAYPTICFAYLMEFIRILRWASYKT